MPKAEAARELDEVEALVGPVLKERGFRVRGRTFNRATEPGMVQVVSLQAGRFPVGVDMKTARALSLYGSFTVNVGVAVREIHESKVEEPLPDMVPEAACALRARLGQLAEGADRWWGLDDPRAAAREVSALLLQYGLPFLDRFGSRAAIVSEWIRYNESERDLSSRARVDVGVILARAGDTLRARELLQEQFERSAGNPPHQDYLRALAARLGIGTLVE